MLDVPLSPDRESPLPDRENTLPESWFLDPEDDAVAAPHFTEPGGMAGFFMYLCGASSARHGAQKIVANAIVPFGTGESLRLGYTPCGSLQQTGRQFFARLGFMPSFCTRPRSFGHPFRWGSRELQPCRTLGGTGIDW